MTCLTLTLCLWVLQETHSTMVVTVTDIIYSYSGHAAFLECHSNSRCYNGSFWQFGENTIAEGERVGNNFTENFGIIINNTYTLYIKNVTRNTKGLYTCVAGEHINNFELKIIEQDCQEYQLNIIPTNPIFEGSNITLECKIGNDSKSNEYTWKKEGSIITSTAGKYKHRNISRTDSGVYSCAYGNITIQTYLNVYYTPTVHIEQVDNILYCNISDGNPSAFTYNHWEYRPYGNTSRIIGEKSGILVLQYDSDYYLQNGNYTCAINHEINEKGETMLIRSAAQDVILEGHPVCLHDDFLKPYECHDEEIFLQVYFYSHPPGNFTWVQSGRHIVNSSLVYPKTYVNVSRVLTYIKHKTKVITLTGFLSTLFIQKLHDQDCGKYELHISNIYGQCNCQVEPLQRTENHLWLKIYLLASGILTMIVLFITAVFSRYKQKRRTLCSCIRQ